MGGSGGLRLAACGLEENGEWRKMGDRRCGSVVAGLGEIGDGRARSMREEWRRNKRESTG